MKDKQIKTKIRQNFHWRFWVWRSADRDVKVKINISEELLRFQAGLDSSQPVALPDLITLLSVITAYFDKLERVDWQIAKAVREIGPQLVANLNRLMEQLALEQGIDRSQHTKDNVLFAIYDRIENLLIVAKTKQERSKAEIYQQLLDYLQVIYAQELEWIRMESIGRSYNPYDYDGFAIDRICNSQGDPSGMEIVNELRAGFRCRGRVIRKPVVEFYE
ncbi:MAG: hypothetical protein PVH64_01015 [Bacillota bacterium]|jgi:hypothetical protein